MKFVPPKLAVKLKAKGFNEPCVMVDCNGKRVPIMTAQSSYPNPFPTVRNSELGKSTYAVPLYDEVIDWLLSKNYYAEASSFPVYHDKYGFRFGRGRNLDGFTISKGDTRYEAMDEAIEKVLDIMPKKTY